jgi:hypothetical protein
MLPVHCVNVSSIATCLFQAKAILVVTLRAYQGELPEVCQNAIWAAADLIEHAAGFTEAPGTPPDDLTGGGGI